jgi:hypothetical protein
MNDQTETDQRSEYIAGLRELADLLQDHPEVPLPYNGTTTELLWIEYDRDIIATIIKALPGPVTKHYTAAGQFQAKTRLHGLRVEVVCERVVVGTETVTVPAVEARPEAIVEQEIVEWRCHPILADDRGAAVS